MGSSVLRTAAELATEGNGHSNQGDLLKAVECYTRAIQVCPGVLTPILPRLYMNRALNQFKMDFFYLALFDINQAIALSENNAKYYFIRSKILKKLGEYELAEIDLQAAAKLDSSCDEIQEEIVRLRENDKDSYIFKDKLSCYNLYDPYFYKIKVNFHLVKAQNLPTNVWNYYGIRVENINSEMPYQIIEAYFSLFGDITAIKRIHSWEDNMLIHYNNPVTPMFTIAYYQGRIVEELCSKEECLFKPLRLYFVPSDSQSNLKFARPKYPLLNSHECYYWRTTTCHLKTRCPKLHLPVNQQIDAQIWMKDKTFNSHI